MNHDIFAELLKDHSLDDLRRVQKVMMGIKDQKYNKDYIKRHLFRTIFPEECGKLVSRRDLSARSINTTKEMLWAA